VVRTGSLRVLIAAGGTGGHIYPGVTIAGVLKRRRQDACILFVGREGGMEEGIIQEAGFRMRTIRARYLQRRLSLELLATAGTLAVGLWQSYCLIRSFRPDLVIGTGGYVSAPVIFLASCMGLPTFIQEQNAFPGVTNRVLGRVASKIAIAYRDAEAYFPRGKTVLTGNPVRPEIMTAERSQGIRAFGLDPDKRTVLITGGSQGASTLNRAVIEGAGQLAAIPGVQYVFLCGKNHYDSVKQQLEGLVSEGRMRLFPYTHDMPLALAAADLVVGRSGAILLAEITARGIPAILVPYPYAAANHQEKNARTLEKHGAARVILDRDLNGRVLCDVISGLLASGKVLEDMRENSRRLGRPDAAASIVDEAMKLV